MEMDKRSPRLRLSIIGYLLDAGRDPDLKVVDELVTYVAEDTSAYADDVSKISDPDEDNTIKDVADQTKNAYEQLGDGYL